MISVEEATDRIASCVQPRQARTVATSEALGMVLAEDITSDIDSPLNDKAMMDGYAVRSSETGSGSRLRVVEQVTAGEVPTLPIASGQATQIMTGAPIPDGADCVIMVEQTQRDDNQTEDIVVLQGPPLGVGQNILRRATSLREGEVVLKRGHRIRAIETGLLLEVGRTEVAVLPRPRVAVISTGNELISPAQKPSIGQIRNSNGPMLEAQVRQAGGEVVSLGIGRDDEAELRTLMTRGLNDADVLVLSGGVSAGVLDLVPRLLSEIDVEQVFHKVQLKPGKPLWFGKREQQGKNKLVFGLPGNPNSSLVCFELFVRPALGQLCGRADNGLPRISASLAEAHHHRGNRPTYFPARVDGSDANRIVRPLAWKGSADQRTLCMANCLLFLPAGDSQYHAGDEVSVLLL